MMAGISLLRKVLTNSISIQPKKGGLRFQITEKQRTGSQNGKFNFKTNGIEIKSRKNKIIV